MKHNYYGFTYKKNTLPVASNRDYDPIINLLRSKYDNVSWVYETDKKGLQHIHGIVDFNRRNPLFKTLVPQGFSARFHEIHDMKGWIRYLTKEDGNKEMDEMLEAIYCDIDTETIPESQARDALYFRHNYAF